MPVQPPGPTDFSFHFVLGGCASPESRTPDLVHRGEVIRSNETTLKEFTCNGKDMSSDDAWALSEHPMKDNAPVPAGRPAALAEPADVRVTDIPLTPAPVATDPKQALRERLEAEELAKIEEEQMRAEIRGRLLGQQAASAPAPAPVAPPPVIVNITNANTNTNNNVATATVGAVAAGRRHPATIWRLLYFLFIGCWLGPIWVAVALLFCLSFVGLPIGLMMLSRALDAFIL